MVPDPDEELMRIAVVITREQYRWLLALAAKNTPHLRAHAPHTVGNDKLTAEDVAGALIEAAFIGTSRVGNHGRFSPSGGNEERRKGTTFVCNKRRLHKCSACGILTL